MTLVMVDNEPIVLLNFSYEPLSTNYGLKKAIRLLALDKATIEEGDPERFLDSLGRWIWPKVLRLRYYVKIAHDKLYGAPRVSKRGIMIRDNRKCAYCNGPADTVDHIHPRSKTGPHSWMNLIAACKPCNNKKRNRTPEEAGMTLLFQPFVPMKINYRNQVS